MAKDNINNTREKFLPIGTIVKLQDSSKKMMITGFCVTVDGEENKIYDYSGCFYPEGILSSSQTGIFNHEQIEFIYSMGFSDPEEKLFKMKLKDLINKQSKDLNTNDSSSEYDVEIIM